MKWAITGARGFLGSSLARKLLEEGEEVRAIPRDMLNNYFSLRTYLEAEQPDHIIHFAAYGNHSFQQDLDETVAANIGYLVTLLQASRHIEYVSLLNVSSSAVTLPTSTFYTATKRAGEDLVRTFAKLHHQNAFSVRPFSVYGPGEAPFRFIPTVISSAKAGKAFNLVPEASHDWIYIDDFVDATITLAKKRKEEFFSAAEIGTGISHTNLDVVRELETIHGKDIDYDFVDVLRSFDTPNWECSTSVKHLLGREPTSLAIGLSRTYAHY